MIESALSEHGQMLGFEPPRFGAGATLGGTIACGFSGPRRPFAGSARDFVLGCKLLNGQGEIVSFGGEVMKNVAGFDVSRLMVGALGTLGVLLQVSLKVLPRPSCETTLSFECTADAARERMLRWSSRALPVSALAYDDGLLRVRLSGAEPAVRAAQQQLGGDASDTSGAYWIELREQTLPFFRGTGDLWRISVPPAAPVSFIEGECLIDWGGALRWVRTEAAASAIFAAAEKAGGHALLFRASRGEGRFQPLGPPLRTLHRRLKQAFDPHGIFNIGRMYEDW
jgi:glycolate oxidase FAD binding subunit